MYIITRNVKSRCNCNFIITKNVELWLATWQGLFKIWTRTIYIAQYNWEFLHLFTVIVQVTFALRTPFKCFVTFWTLEAWYITMSSRMCLHILWVLVFIVTARFCAVCVFISVSYKMCIKLETSHEPFLTFDALMPGWLTMFHFMGSVLAFESKTFFTNSTFKHYFIMFIFML